MLRIIFWSTMTYASIDYDIHIFKKNIFKIFIYKTKKTFSGVGTVPSLAEPVSLSWLLWWHTMLVRKGTCWSASPALKHSLCCLSITSAGGFTPPPSTFPYLGKCSTAVSFTAPVLTAGAQQYLQQLPTSPRHQQLLSVGPGVAVLTHIQVQGQRQQKLAGGRSFKTTIFGFWAIYKGNGTTRSWLSVFPDCTNNIRHLCFQLETSSCEVVQVNFRFLHPVTVVFTCIWGYSLGHLSFWKLDQSKNSNRRRRNM